MHRLTRAVVCCCPASANAVGEIGRRRTRGTFNRVQCNADLMPSDITGIHIFSREEKKFEFVPGPLFANIVLVDEINARGRGSAALLQAWKNSRSPSTARPTACRRTSGHHQNPRDFEGTPAQCSSTAS